MRTTWITILNPPPPFTDLCTSLHTPTPKLLSVSSVLIRGLSRVLICLFATKPLTLFHLVFHPKCLSTHPTLDILNIGAMLMNGFSFAPYPFRT